MLYRMDLPHFRNNTNNRLENLFGELKIDLSKSMSMKQCLDSVLRYQRRREDEYVARVAMPGTSRNLSYGEEMNQQLGMTSEWLAEVFLSEYTFADNSENVHSYDIHDEELM
ncbi:unnamed protein product [Phytophthora fragariaefolia]|uniref:Unnamed protein product n=1 Tax=Phytophthora fragariaefolia TaxID=1490495 RepID=A0A9W6Y024_9STRA|nr:unnamed protein product [Phytophthora fragariaefolia]